MIAVVSMDRSGCGDDRGVYSRSPSPVLGDRVSESAVCILSRPCLVFGTFATLYEVS